MPKKPALFAAGVLVIALPSAALLYLLLNIVFRVYREVQQYRGTTLQADVTLDETTGLIAVSLLVIFCVGAGLSLIRRSRDDSSLSITGR